jgi:hypothetical protein
MMDKRNVVPAPGGEIVVGENDFVVGDKLTVFDAAMIYSGRHPRPKFLSDRSVEDRLRFLRAGYNRRRATRRSWDVLQELLTTIKAGRIEPVRLASSVSGAIDPTRTVIRTQELVDLAVRRNERPRYLAHLLSRRGQAPPSAVTTAKESTAQRAEARVRGRRSYKLEQTKEAMRSDVGAGVDVGHMLEKHLEERYSVSRDTARKAREAVLAERGLSIDK